MGWGLIQMTGSEAMKAFVKGLEIMIIPTSGVLMAMFGLIEIPDEKWVRFMLPLFLYLCVIAFAILGVAVVTGY